MVLVSHALVAWALMRGSAFKGVEFAQQSVQVTLVAEAPSAPSPLPEPAKPKVPTVAKAENTIQPTPLPAQSVQARAAEPVGPAEAPAVAPAAISLPSATATATTPESVAGVGAPADLSAAQTPAASPAHSPAPKVIGLVCPKQVAPVMPRRASQEGLSGTVTARATVRSGRVVAVEILSAKPRGVFEMAVKQAMMQYQCDSSAPGDVLADQVFEFKLEP